MKKVVTGAAIVTSLFLMGGCSSSNSKSSQSSSSSVKISKSELSSKKSQKLEDATTDVDSLFSDSDHTALVPGTKKLLIDEVSKEVNKLTDSKGKSNLQKNLRMLMFFIPSWLLQLLLPTLLQTQKLDLSLHQNQVLFYL